MSSRRRADSSAQARSKRTPERSEALLASGAGAAAGCGGTYSPRSHLPDHVDTLGLDPLFGPALPGTPKVVVGPLAAIVEPKRRSSPHASSGCARSSRSLDAASAASYSPPAHARPPAWISSTPGGSPDFAWSSPTPARRRLARMRARSERFRDVLEVEAQPCLRSVAQEDRAKTPLIRVYPADADAVQLGDICRGRETDAHAWPGLLSQTLDDPLGDRLDVLWFEPHVTRPHVVCRSPAATAATESPSWRGTGPDRPPPRGTAGKSYPPHLGIVARLAGCPGRVGRQPAGVAAGRGGRRVRREEDAAAADVVVLVGGVRWGASGGR